MTVEGFPKFPWSHLIPCFPQFGRKMQLGLPCLGLDALSAGLREIRWEGFEISFAYDIDESLIPVLLDLHGPHTNLHVGRHRGDLLVCNIDELPPVDFIISGPPCPPFSSTSNATGKHAGGSRRSSAQGNSTSGREDVDTTSEK